MSSFKSNVSTETVICWLKSCQNCQVFFLFSLNLKSLILNSNLFISEEISNMENEYPSLVTVFSNEADWSLVVPALLVSKEPDNVETFNKVRIKSR